MDRETLRGKPEFKIVMEENLTFECEWLLRVISDEQNFQTNDPSFQTEDQILQIDDDDDLQRLLMSADEILPVDDDYESHEVVAGYERQMGSSDTISAAVASESKTKRKQTASGRWSRDEHRRFLEGVARCGWGNWTLVAKNHVTTRTTVQIGSHAKKYFKRQNNQEKKRKSIHDPPVNNVLIMPEPIELVPDQISGSSISASDVCTPSSQPVAPVFGEEEAMDPAQFNENMEIDTFFKYVNSFLT